MSQAEIITKKKNDCLHNVQWRDGTVTLDDIFNFGYYSCMSE